MSKKKYKYYYKLKQCYEHTVVSNKVDYLDEMDRFLERYKPLKMAPNEIENLHRPVKQDSINKKTFPHRVAQAQIYLPINSTKYLKTN